MKVLSMFSPSVLWGRVSHLWRLCNSYRGKEEEGVRLSVYSTFKGDTLSHGSYGGNVQTEILRHLAYIRTFSRSIRETSTLTWEAFHYFSVFTHLRIWRHVAKLSILTHHSNFLEALRLLILNLVRLVSTRNSRHGHVASRIAATASEIAIGASGKEGEGGWDTIMSKSTA